MASTSFSMSLSMGARLTTLNRLALSGDDPAVSSGFLCGVQGDVGHADQFSRVDGVLSGSPDPPILTVTGIR